MKRRGKKSDFFRFPKSRWWRRGQALADFFGGAVFSLAEQIFVKLVALLKILYRTVIWISVKARARKKNVSGPVEDEPILPSTVIVSNGNLPPQAEDAVAALITLDVPKANARPAVIKAVAILGPGATVQQLITEGLKYRRGIIDLGVEK